MFASVDVSSAETSPAVFVCSDKDHSAMIGGKFALPNACFE
jgi:hypothetical protein